MARQLQPAVRRPPAETLQAVIPRKRHGLGSAWRGEGGASAAWTGIVLEARPTRRRSRSGTYTAIPPAARSSRTSGRLRRLSSVLAFGSSVSSSAHRRSALPAFSTASCHGRAGRRAAQQIREMHAPGAARLLADDGDIAVHVLAHSSQPAALAIARSVPAAHVLDRGTPRRCEGGGRSVAELGPAAARQDEHRASRCGRGEPPDDTSC